MTEYQQGRADAIRCLADHGPALTRSFARDLRAINPLSLYRMGFASATPSTGFSFFG